MKKSVTENFLVYVFPMIFDKLEGNILKKVVESKWTESFFSRPSVVKLKYSAKTFNCEHFSKNSGVILLLDVDFSVKKVSRPGLINFFLSFIKKTQDSVKIQLLGWNLGALQLALVPAFE